MSSFALILILSFGLSSFLVSLSKAGAFFYVTGMSPKNYIHNGISFMTHTMNIPMSLLPSDLLIPEWHLD